MDARMSESLTPAARRMSDEVARRARARAAQVSQQLQTEQSP